MGSHIAFMARSSGERIIGPGFHLKLNREVQFLKLHASRRPREATVHGVKPHPDHIKRFVLKEKIESHVFFYPVRDLSLNGVNKVPATFVL
jgi:hypothetical protein